MYVYIDEFTYVRYVLNKSNQKNEPINWRGNM